LSRERLEKHRHLWRAKPALPAVYAPWFEVLLEQLPEAARVLEIGSGPGLLRDEARRRRPDLRWIASELLETPWNDLVADGLQLPVAEGRLDAVLGLDLLHHLSRPRRFFIEASRVLRDGGLLRVVEPWDSAFSYPIYRYLHEEGCDRTLDPWEPFDAGKQAFEGDAAVLRRLLSVARDADWAACGLTPPAHRLFNGFAYLLSGGFQEWSLLPRPVIPMLQWLDRQTEPVAPWLAMRALATWKRLPR
jgi:SAM-dependent methyltransferase